MKKIFENAVWWSGVIMVGLILGISLQFVRAWTEPTVAPPGGNVGAPINTSLLGQIKQGVLQVAGLTVYNNPAVGGDVTGKVLTAQNANGAVAWAPGLLRCRKVENTGGAPNYISYAKCASDEFILSGGGYCETVGGPLCAGVSTGVTNANYPAQSNDGWITDCVRADNAGLEACSRAYAICCKKNSYSLN